MRFTDNFRRRVIMEIRDRGRVIWDPTQPHFRSCGARADAFHGVAYRLHDASIALDIRRMWNRWMKAMYNYKLGRLSRRPKFAREMSFIDDLGMDAITQIAHIF